MPEPTPISDVVWCAAEALDALVDLAVDRVVGDTPMRLPESIWTRARELSAPGSATEDESRSASVVAGVTRRVIEGLRDAPMIPQSMIFHRQHGAQHARASGLDVVAMWRLAGRVAMSSAAAVARADRFSDWVRSSFLLIEGAGPMEPNDPRSLWTLAHAEAAHADLNALAEIAAQIVGEQREASFAGSLLACEHAAVLDRTPREAEHPLCGIALSCTPRFALTDGVPPDVPADFQNYIFQQA